MLKIKHQTLTFEFNLSDASDNYTMPLWYQATFMRMRLLMLLDCKKISIRKYLFILSCGNSNV